MPTITDTNDPTAEDIERHTHERRVFQVHMRVAAASLVLIFMVNLFVNLGAGLTGSWTTWWSGWALVGWAMGLGIHWLVVRLNAPEGFRTR